MANFNTMANRAAIDYATAINAAYQLRGMTNSKQVDILVEAINHMYQDVTYLINESITPEEERTKRIEVPNFMYARRVI